MSNNIPGITQDEFDPNLLPNPSLTMAIPYVASLSVPQLPKNKLIQSALWGQVVVPNTKHASIPVQTHYRGSSKVQAHKQCQAKWQQEK